MDPWPTKKIKYALIGLGVIFLFGEVIYSYISNQEKRGSNRLPTTQEAETIKKEMNSYHIKIITLPAQKIKKVITSTPISPTEVAQYREGQISSIKTARVVNQSTRYTVQEGDSLAQIAYEMYGDEQAWTIIASANHISSPDAIEKGMVLTIPRSSRSRNSYPNILE